MPYPMCDRPGSLLPPYARRRSQVAVPQAGSAARKILPRFARSTNKDERVRRQLEHIHERHAQSDQE